jgi:hypothetical protein
MILTVGPRGAQMGETTGVAGGFRSAPAVPMRESDS